MSHLLCFSILLCLVLCVKSIDLNKNMEPPDTSQWVDPWDMGKDYDPRPKSMREALFQCQGVQQSLDACKSSLQLCEEQRGSAGTEECKVTKPTVEKYNPFLLRHLKHLIYMFEPVAKLHHSKYQMTVDLSSEDLVILKKFVSKSAKVSQSDVDAILSNFIQSVEPFYEKSFTEAFPGYIASAKHYLPTSEDIVWLTLMSVTLTVTVMLWNGTALWKICCLLLVFSSAWHWMHMYKKALGQKHTVLIQSKQVPAECVPDEMSWGHFIFDTVFSRKDKCQKYHEALLVDPLWEVTPTMAIMETFTKFLLLPLGHLGHSIGKFFDSLLAELSWASASIVLAFVFVAIILVLVMLFGYSLRLPFFLGSFEPVRDHHTSIHKEIQNFRQEFSSLKQQSSQEAIATSSADPLNNIQQELQALKQNMAPLLALVGKKEIEVLPNRDATDSNPKEDAILRTKSDTCITSVPAVGEGTSTPRRQTSSPQIVSPPSTFKDKSTSDFEVIENEGELPDDPEELAACLEEVAEALNLQTEEEQKEFAEKVKDIYKEKLFKT